MSRITTNAFLDDVRRRRRRPTVALPDDTDAVMASSEDVEQTHAAATLPEEVQAALCALPEDFRVAVVLCDVVGLRYDEIAEQLGVPVGTVRSRIHRGRLALRKRLG